MTGEITRADTHTTYDFHWTYRDGRRREPSLAELEDATMRVRMIGAVGDEVVRFIQSGFRVEVASSDLLPRPAVPLVRRADAYRAAWVLVALGLIFGFFVGLAIGSAAW